jgi:hypothetical protein
VPVARYALAVVVAALPVAACSRDVPPPPEATTESPEDASPTERVVGPLTPAQADSLATMNERLKDYVALHQKVESGLPALPNEATPQQIDRRQRQLEQRMRAARAGAKPGDIFTPEARPVIRRLLAQVFDGPEGKQLKASIMDENPTKMKVTLRANARYPDTVPISTVPPEVLQALPKLAEDMEYRFIGRALILLDAHAHTIADFIDDAIPA